MGRALLISLSLVPLACGIPVTNGSYPGEPLVTLRGQLLADPARAPSRRLKLAVAWYGQSTSNSPGTLRAVSNWPEEYSAPFPERFAGSLFAPPPREALAGESATDGVLIAYLDGNSNGELDGAGVGEPSPDTVLGSSLGEDGAEGYRLVYREVEAPESPASPPGFGLVSNRTGVVAFSTSVPIVLTSSPTLQQLLCRTTALAAEPGAHCSQAPPLAALRVSGSLGVLEGKSSVELTVEDAFGALSVAAVSVNQIPIAFSPEKKRYSAFAPPFLKAGEANQLSVRAAGYQELDLAVDLPGTFQLTAPLFNASAPSGASLVVSWTAASGAQGYRVLLSDSSFKTLFEGETEALSISTPAIGYTGSATLNISAGARVVRTDGGSLLLGYVNDSLPLRFE